MSLGDRAARGSKVVLLTQAVRAGLQFASMIILARLLDPSVFGLVAMVTAVIGIADLVRDFGLSSAAIQSPTLSRDERTNLFWVNLGFGALCTAVVASCAPLIQAIYDQAGLTPIILSLSAVFLISGANTQFRADLTRSMRYGKLAAADITAQAVGIAVAAGLAVAGAGVWALVAQQLTVAIVSLAMNVVSTRWLPGPPRRRVSLRRFFAFGSSLFATQALTYLTKNVDNIALGVYSGPYQLGLYSRAYQLLMTPLNQINAPMTGVALPVLSKIQDDDERFARYLGRAQLVACYLTASIFAVAAGVSGPLTLVLFGEAWAPVAPIFAILAIGGIFRSIQQIAYWTYLAKGRTGAQLKMILVTRPLMIAIILAGVPWGPIGVAVGHTVAYFLFWLVSVRHVGRVTGVDSARLLRNAVRPVALVSLPAGAVAFAATLLPLPPLADLGAGVVAAGLFVVLMIAVVRPVREDVSVLRDFVRRAGGRST
ncbi:lipopolysaccharide biosynthesis protein [Nakamurella deserti]|uniref:lipopolysaccharide biosynthesis protein n=1 Tax=Nakamurella deserti TaxID=2164074 RepID=UPI000DBE9267|nr:lipopolysaccharide biosynthesis protein [Nakamurella deserti]